MTTVIQGIIKIANFLGQFANPVTRTMSILTVVTSIYVAVSGHIDALIIAIDSLVVSSSGTLDLRPLAFANYVFPLAEAITLVIGYLALMAAAATIRIIKSWLPTVN